MDSKSHICYETFKYAVQHDPSTHRRSYLQSNTIDRIDHEMQYETFFREYLLPNKPCILSNLYTNSWLSRKEWITSQGAPNFEFLSKTFGEAIVPVTNCDVNVSASDCQSKTDMKLSNFMLYFSKHNAGEGDKNELPYLKDWHFVRKFQNYEAYKVPHFFSSDWLNEYCDHMQDDDFKFVYMGAKGTWTPFHADVYRSNSWSANVCGRKRWYIFPPGMEECFRDVNGYLAGSVLLPNLVNNTKYPNMSKARTSKACIEVVQNAGEVIFVPSGWHHEVYNLEDTISINQNWFNGCNIDMVWEVLANGLVDVEKEIADCTDSDTFHEDCQNILNINHGMDYQKFYSLLKFISCKRVEHFSEHSDSNNYHVAFDLLKLQSTLTNFLENIILKNLQVDFTEDLKELLSVVSNQVASVSLCLCDSVG